MAQQPGPDPLEFLNFGVLGVVVASFLLGWIWPKPSVDRLLADKDRLLEQQAKQLEAMQAEMHALHKETRAVHQELAELIRWLHREPRQPP